MKWIAFLLFFVFSCSNPKSNEFKIKKSVFLDILTEMYIKESVLQYSDYIKKDSLNDSYSYQILKKHNITKEVFLNDYKNYYNNSVVFDSIIQVVIERITNKKDKNIKDE